MSQGVSKTRYEVKELERLRRLFLEAPNTSGLADYWQDLELLELYDTTFARRIAWKWNSVMTELAHRHWRPPPSIARWIDWGCGTGVASETMIEAFGSQLPSEIVMTDRSARARQFARDKTRMLASSVTIHECAPQDLKISSTDLILLSHVLTELTAEQLRALNSQLALAGAVIWVEPGTPFCSRRLIQMRRELSQSFRIVSPCPHQGRCGVEDSENDWCHMFALPPKEVFQDPQWARLSKELNIDLRSLPTSFLVLESFAAGSSHHSRESSEHQKTKKQRLLARPRFYKGHAKVIVCEESGLKQLSLSEKLHKKEFKQWQKDSFFVEFTSDQDSDL